MAYQVMADIGFFQVIMNIDRGTAGKPEYGIYTLFFQAFNNPAIFLLIAPLIGLGALYWYGRPQPRKAAVFLAVGLPILTLAISGIQPVLRVSQRGR